MSPGEREDIGGIGAEYTGERRETFDFSGIKAQVSKWRRLNQERQKSFAEIQAREEQKRYAEIETEQIRLYEELLGLEDDPRFTAEIQEILQGLLKAAGITEEIRLITVKSEEVNAFVFTVKEKRPEGSYESVEEKEAIYGKQVRGNTVFLYTGLIKKCAEHQLAQGKKLSRGNLAFVIAHELRHLLQQREEGVRLVKRRQEEYDADRGGIETMGKAGHNPREGVEAMEFLKERGKGQFAYSETHPATASRLVEMNKRIADPDLPVRGINAKRTDFENPPESSSRSAEITALIKNSSSLQDLVTKLNDSARNLTEVAVMLPICKEAINYDHLRRLAQSPKALGLALKYIYHLGIELHQRAEKDGVALAERKARMQFLEQEGQTRPLTPEEQGELRLGKREIAGDEEKIKNYEALLYDSIKSNACLPDENKKAKPWGDQISFAPEERGLAPAEEARLQFVLGQYSLKQRSSMNSMDVSTEKSMNWEQTPQKWLEGGKLPDEITTHIDIGLKLFGEQGKDRGKLLVDTALFLLQENLDKTYSEERNSKDHESRQDFKSLQAELVAEQLSVFESKAAKFIDESLPAEATREIKEAARNFLLDQLIPSLVSRQADRYPTYGPRPQEPELAKAVLAAAARIIVDIYRHCDSVIARLAGKDRQSSYEYSSLFRAIQSLARGQMDPETIKKAQSAFLCRVPGYSSEINELENLSTNALPRNIEGCIQFWEEKQKKGMSEDEARILKRKIYNMSFGADAQFRLLLATHQIEADINSLDEQAINHIISALIDDDMSNYSRHCLLDYLGTGALDAKAKFLIERARQGLVGYENSSIFMRKIPEFAASQGVTTDEALRWCGELGLVIDDDYLKQWFEEGKISSQALKTYYNLLVKEYAENNDEKSSVSDDKMGDIYKLALRGILRDIAPEELEKLSQEHHGYLYESHLEDKFEEIIRDGQFSYDDVSELLPKNVFLNRILFLIWEKNNFPPEDFEKIYNLCVPETAGVFHGKNRFTLATYLEVGSESPDEVKAGASERFRDLEASGRLVDYEAVRAHSDRGLFAIVERKFFQDPEYFGSSTANLQENVARVTSMVPASEFCDYLLKRCLKLELWNLSGERPKDLSVQSAEDRVADPEIIYNLSQGDKSNQLIVDNLDFPPRDKLESVSKEQLIIAVRTVFPHVKSRDQKLALGKAAMELLDLSDKNEELAAINEFFPEPSPTRDHYLKGYLLKYSLTLEEILRTKALLSSELVVGGEVATEELLGLEIFREEMKNLSSDARQRYLLWLLEVDQATPEELRVSGGIFGVKFDSLKADFNELSSTERTKLLEEFLLGDGGIFDPKNPEQLKEMNQFLGQVFEKRLDPQTAERELVKKIFLAAFEASIPERRMGLFTSLLTGLREKGAKMEFEDLLVLFLEQVGVFGNKAGQILSEREDMPFGQPGQKMSESLKEKLGKLKEGVEPFNTIGVVYGIEDNGRQGEIRSLEKLLSTASIKQVHLALAGEGERVVKIRKPNVEKYIEHDSHVLAEICKVLEKAGHHVPKYFVEYVTGIIKDESDFLQESENHRKLGENLSGEREGWTLEVTKIHYSSADLMEESVAPGVSLDKISSSNPKLYEKVCGIVAREFAYSMFVKGVFHADLHDGNIFVDEQNKKITFIDAGAVGTANDKEKVQMGRFFKGAVLRDSLMLARSILSLNNEKRDDNRVKELAVILDKSLGKDLSLEERLQKISFEVLDFSLPSKTLQYTIKALVTSAHHLRRAVPSLASEKRLSARELIQAARALGRVGLNILEA